MLQNDFLALQKEVQATLHSRELYRHAKIVYENPDMFDRIKRAWAVWVLANMSFNNAHNNNFTRSSDGKFSRKIAANRERFSDELAERIGGVQIECRDAIKVIEANDTHSSFFMWIRRMWEHVKDITTAIRRKILTRLLQCLQH